MCHFAWWRMRRSRRRIRKRLNSSVSQGKEQCMSQRDREALATPTDLRSTGQLPRRSVLRQGAALGLGFTALTAIQRMAAATGANKLRAANLRFQANLAADQVVRLPEGEPVRFDPGVTSGGKGLEMLQNL